MSCFISYMDQYELILNMALGSKHQCNLNHPFICWNFDKRHKKVIAIYIVPPHRHCTIRWNPSLCKTRTHLFYKISVMGTDVLATATVFSNLISNSKIWFSIISFPWYKLNPFTNSIICTIISVIWIPCTNSVVLIGIFTAYNCMYLILASVCLCARVCACVYISV